MKLTVRELKKIIAEGLLLETDDVALEAGDSLDTQIDKYFSQYEKESKASKNEGKDFRMMMKRFLREAAGDDDEEEDSKGEDDSVPGKISSEKLDVSSFASSVMRLIDNYDSLLELRTTVAKRAINFLSKTYEPDVVESFKTIMRNDFGLVPGDTEQDVKDDNFAAPPADRAGPGLGSA